MVRRDTVPGIGGEAPAVGGPLPASDGPSFEPFKGCC